MNTIWIVLPILTVLMFELGLNLSWNDFKLFKSRPKPIIAGLIGQLILLPLIAYFLCRIMNLPDEFLIGFVLIACSPGGSSSNVFSMLAKGDVALSVSLTACSSIITLFTIPLVMGLVCSSVMTGSVDIHLPIGKLFMQNIVLMFVPIIIGIIVKRCFSNFSTRCHRILSRFMFPALIILITVFFVQNKQAIIDNFAQMGVASSMLIIAAMGGGILLSYLFRLKGAERRTIVIEVGMQNAAQAIAVATSPIIFNSDTMAIPAIIYALMMNVILLIYVVVVKKYEKD